MLSLRQSVSVQRTTEFLRSQLIAVTTSRTQTSAALKEATTTDDIVNAEWQQARPFQDIPRETPWGLLRNLMPGGKYRNLDLRQMMLAMQSHHGNIFILPRMLGRPLILATCNPNDFERVFRSEGVWPERPGSDPIQYHREKHRADFFQGVEGLISTQSKTWGDFRTLVNPILMQPKTVRLYYKKMSEVNKQFIECIKNIRDTKSLEVPADFVSYINRWTLESVSVVALDKQLGLLNNTEMSPDTALLFKSLNEFFENYTELEMKPSPWRWIATPKFKKLMVAFDNLQKLSAEYVNEAIERLHEEQKNGITRPESEQSVLEKLLKVDKKVATVMAMDMLQAGVDTTSSTFTGLLLCIAKNPEKQAKLREEVLRILPNKDSEFTEESMKNVPYLRACIKEALRIYPLALGNSRVTKRDDVLSGYRVPKGTLISMIPTTLLKDEQYFPRPNEYLPERWLRSEKSSDETSKCPANELKATNPFVYLPFGFGPRMCIGKRIVDMELELGLARVIRNFHVEFNYPTDKAFKSLIISIPNIPLQFKFTDIA